jgi:hypothetical protein
MPSIPATMRQVRFNGAGGPEVIGIETVPVRRPRGPARRWRRAAAGTCRRAAGSRAGSRPPPRPRPAHQRWLRRVRRGGGGFVPAQARPALPRRGSRPAGELALGEVGHALPQGDDAPGDLEARHVGGAGRRRVLEGQEVCALTISGGYAEYAVAEAALCLPKPGPLSLVRWRRPRRRTAWRAGSPSSRCRSTRHGPGSARPVVRRRGEAPDRRQGRRRDPRHGRRGLSRAQREVAGRAGGGEDLGAEPLGELDRRRADAARPAMDQEALAPSTTARPTSPPR